MGVHFLLPFRKWQVRNIYEIYSLVKAIKQKKQKTVHNLPIQKHFFVILRHEITKEHKSACSRSILGCKYIGDPDHIISGFNEIHLVEKGDATFTDVAKYYEKALKSAATTIISI